MQQMLCDYTKAVSYVFVNLTHRTWAPTPQEVNMADSDQKKGEEISQKENEKDKKPVTEIKDEELKDVSGGAWGVKPTEKTWGKL